jgi:hypothetical protein
MVHEIQINRVCKSSPYNCAAVIPAIECDNRGEIINLPEVQALINKTYGKKLIVQVLTPFETSYLQYEIVKSKAVL